VDDVGKVPGFWPRSRGFDSFLPSHGRVAQRPERRVLTPGRRGFDSLCVHQCRVAQQAERRVVTPEVEGSIPSLAAKGQVGTGRPVRFRRPVGSGELATAPGGSSPLCSTKGRYANIRQSGEAQTFVDKGSTPFRPTAMLTLVRLYQ
jgi:hypothetical protein